ncbi:MAG: FAD-dependent thymidylate synthase [Chloroflexi bacterium]|nr:FAD-dependent thymidylate synthase [Chloroflexota bacterium]
MAIDVRLVDHTHDPIRTLYTAYRVCYSSFTPAQIEARIADERISAEQMREFVEARLATGHTSPLQQVWFEFGISGVSRAFSHQFVRHHMGISFEQQSQRYVTYKDGTFPYTVPESVRRAGMAEQFKQAMATAGQTYEAMIAAGVPAEDARFLLPNATNTNFKVSVNYLELLHIADQRLCTRAQWEFRKVVSLMRAEVKRRFPSLGVQLQPKCGEARLGYCDEAFKDWEACPIGRKRPHKSTLFALYERQQSGALADLGERDFELIEREQTDDAEPY